jgi:hypothetical protein
MKILKMALAAAFTVASTSAMATAVETQKKGETADASYCELAVIVIAPDGVYGIYECTYVGGGWY